MSNNLALWDSLEKTHPGYTKTFKRPGGFSGTAINATWIIKRLTEMFGPCGRGWKFVLEDEKIHIGPFLDHNAGVNVNRAQLHVVRGHIDYMQEGTWYSTSPQFGQTMLVSMNSYGVNMDEEAPKKSITDCIGKCAVLLGIGADVHLGLFDDNKYVNDRWAEVEGTDANAASGHDAAPPKPLTPKKAAEKAGQVTQENAASAAAKAFGQKVKITLPSLRTKDEYMLWDTPETQTKIARLKQYDEALHSEIIQLMQQTDERLG